MNNVDLGGCRSLRGGITRADALLCAAAPADMPGLAVLECPEPWRAANLV